ncbi:MAG: hypothetical protein DRI90_24150 [Deltaproteobacteria bacterium]|nr:MAG: hypothetical protein DRI90_24150 [Deltaproteobacteria bacterium]
MSDSATTYFLRASPQKDARTVEITRGDFHAYKEAQATLARALAVEQTYEVLVSNYLEFERFLLEEAATAMVRRDKPYERQFAISMRATIRIVNLLTAARMYVEQAPLNVRACVPDVGGMLEKVKGLFSRQYDDHAEYRFMEALRNHVQHHGMPVHWTEQGAGWTSHEGDERLVYWVEIASLRLVLSQNRKFKKRVLAELDDKVDLKLAVRRYVECLSRVHSEMRASLADPTTVARTRLREAHERFGSSDPLESVTLTAIAAPADGDEAVVPLLLEWDDMRLRLVERNKELPNLHKTHASGRVRSHGGRP